MIRRLGRRDLAARGPITAQPACPPHHVLRTSGATSRMMTAHHCRDGRQGGAALAQDGRQDVDVTGEPVGLEPTTP